jgi:predicted dehydrogenase
MLTNRFDPRLDDFVAEAARIGPVGGRGCFISGAFLGGPFARGWRLERGAVLDIGPHLLDLLEAGLGEIVGVQATGDPLGWVSVNCSHASGATSSASMCCAAATGGRTEIEVYSAAGVAAYDARAVDHEARADRIRSDLVAVAGGADHPANVARTLHLQQLIADIETQLRASQ